MSSKSKKPSTPVVPKQETNWEAQYHQLYKLYQDSERELSGYVNQCAPEPTSNLSFGQALKHLKNGDKVRRHDWAQGVILDGKLMPRLLFTEHLCECHTLSIPDLLANDWELF